MKWHNIFSRFCGIDFGVRQGSVLFPLHFVICLDDIVDNRLTTNHNYVIFYADDLLLISTSVCGLKMLLNVCEQELTYLDTSIDVKNPVVCASARVSLIVVQQSVPEFKMADCKPDVHCIRRRTMTAVSPLIRAPSKMWV